MEAILGRFRYAKTNYCFSELQICATSPTQFFPLTIGRDIEAQKKLDQKNHSSLEINSSTVGDIGKKWSKTLPKYSTSIGFSLKIKKLVKFIDFLIFNGYPMEVEYLGEFCSIFHQCRRRLMN